MSNPRKNKSKQAAKKHGTTRNSRRMASVAEAASSQVTEHHRPVVVTSVLLSGAKLTHDVYLQGERVECEILDGHVRFTRDGFPDMRMEGLFAKTPGGWCRVERSVENTQRPLAILGRIILEEA